MINESYDFGIRANCPLKIHRRACSKKWSDDAATCEADFPIFAAKGHCTKRGKLSIQPDRDAE
jgi:hypothetical protein